MGNGKFSSVVYDSGRSSLIKQDQAVNRPNAKALYPLTCSNAVLQFLTLLTGLFKGKQMSKLLSTLIAVAFAAISANAIAADAAAPAAPAAQTDSAKPAAEVKKAKKVKKTKK